MQLLMPRQIQQTIENPSRPDAGIMESSSQPNASTFESAAVASNASLGLGYSSSTTLLSRYERVVVVVLANLRCGSKMTNILYIASIILFIHFIPVRFECDLEFLHCIFCIGRLP